jgi:hypothetical protein
MSTTSTLPVKDLSLDLKNFRTVHQRTEPNAIRAMIAIGPDRFFAVMESIIDDGYLFTENIIVLQSGEKNIVKEGNRRIASLKLIHGFARISDYNIPDYLVDKIKDLSEDWKKENLNVPCTIFSSSEEAIADKVVNLAHGKGEKASRDPWSSVAKARHNRDANKATEAGLDLLEKYLLNCRNLTEEQKEKWAGNYPITILDEAVRKIYPRIGFTAATEIAMNYPTKHRVAVEKLLYDIGIEALSFKTLRDGKNDFAVGYGFPATSAGGTSTTSTTGTKGGSSATTTSGPSSTKKGAKAYAITDPKHVKAILTSFIPHGKNREKVVSLRDELKKLKINDTPLAFCFLLRSMFEISAKAYCIDHHLRTTHVSGKDKTLVQLLREITTHLKGTMDTASYRKVQGAMTEVGTPDRLLSVTSANQLVHSSSFSIAPADISRLFSKVFPLLQAMN